MRPPGLQSDKSWIPRLRYGFGFCNRNRTTLRITHSLGDFLLLLSKARDHIASIVIETLKVKE